MILDHVSPAPAPTECNLAIAGPGDLRFVAHSWRESYKDAPGIDRIPWPAYKATIGKQIEALVAASRVIAAYAADGRVLGWLAYTPGRHLSTVHWTFTRHELHATGCPKAKSSRDACACTPERIRRRGVMTLLLDAAELGRRFAYTHRGPKRVAHNKGQRARHSDRGPTLDLAIVEWLRGRGVSATYVPLEEWSKP